MALHEYLGWEAGFTLEKESQTLGDIRYSTKVSWYSTSPTYPMYSTYLTYPTDLDLSNLSNVFNLSN